MTQIFLDLNIFIECKNLFRKKKCIISYIKGNFTRMLQYDQYLNYQFSTFFKKLS